MLLAPAKKSLQARLPVSSLECPSHGKFEIPALFKDMEWQAGSRSCVGSINSIWIPSKNQTERCINNRHHNLKLHSRARPETGVRSREEFDAFAFRQSFAVDEL